MWSAVRWALLAVSLFLSFLANRSADSLARELGALNTCQRWYGYDPDQHTVLVYGLAPLGIVLALLAVAAGYVARRKGITNLVSRPGHYLCLVLATASTFLSGTSLLRVKSSWTKVSEERRCNEANYLMSAPRLALDTLSRDLLLAGRGTSPALALFPENGGATLPDSLTIVYRDPQQPTMRAVACEQANGSRCRDISDSQWLTIDIEDIGSDAKVETRDFEQGAVLFAWESANCDAGSKPRLYAFEITQAEQIQREGREILRIGHKPVYLPFLNRFSTHVSPECAIIGRLRVIQYHPTGREPNGNWEIERWDSEVALSLSDSMRFVLGDLQLEYRVGGADIWDGSPPRPTPEDFSTWITGARVLARGANLDWDSLPERCLWWRSPLRVRSFSTTVGLRRFMPTQEPWP